MTIKVVGFDPSLRNWGCAVGSYSTDTGIAVDSVNIVQTERDSCKKTRNNSKDLQSAFELFNSVYRIAQGADAVFVEVPVGAKSARAMASYGICIGVLGGLRSMGVPIYEVTPLEVKLSTAGSKTASKQAMIDWANTLYPNINWKKHKDGTLVADSCEHMADAIGAIHAGVLSNDFQRMIHILQNSRKAS